MANTVTNVANLALALIGENEISDIDDANSEAKACKRLFQQVAEEEQKAFFWPELITTDELTGSATALDWYSDHDYYEFSIPADFARLIQYNHNSIVQVGNVWLSSSSEDLKIKYIAFDGDPDSADPSTWSPQLTDCVVYALAIAIIPLLRQDFNVQQLMQVHHAKRGVAQRLSFKDRKTWDTYKSRPFSRGHFDRGISNYQYFGRAR